jgi:hypothetical protein
MSRVRNRIVPLPLGLDRRPGNRSTSGTVAMFFRVSSAARIGTIRALSSDETFDGSNDEWILRPLSSKVALRPGRFNAAFLRPGADGFTANTGQEFEDFSIPGFPSRARSCMPAGPRSRYAAGPLHADLLSGRTTRSSVPSREADRHGPAESGDVGGPNPAGRFGMPPSPAGRHLTTLDGRPAERRRFPSLWRSASRSHRPKQPEFNPPRCRRTEARNATVASRGHRRRSGVCTRQDQVVWAPAILPWFARTEPTGPGGRWWLAHGPNVAGKPRRGTNRNETGGIEPPAP